MTDLTADLPIPDPNERTALNDALHEDGTPTGWWDDHGQPAPWPDDIDQYKPVTGEPLTLDPGQPPL
jgi:hypothetical protein